MRILITTFGLVLFIGITGLAQDVSKADITGVLVDQQQEPLANATVMLLNRTDSVLVSFGVTNAKGVFELKNVEPGEYTLRMTYVGFASETRQIDLGSRAIEDLGSITMQEASEVLSEVEVTADHVPIQISKDTIEYNADAFRTQPNDVVEDLLKKLPGVEVDNEGNIKAQGEDVQNVFVDGKEFFGNDPKIATKNLPADAVDKVQVYDKLSDMAEFSGIDDGERSKSINLSLREDKKKGMFGNAEAGYGSDNRYNAKLNLNRFTGNQQMSVLGMANNTNQQGFSFNDYVTFSGSRGGFRGSGVPLSEGLGNGLVNTLAGGVNYNAEFADDKVDLRSSYFYNGVENDLTQELFRQTFINNDVFERDEESAEQSENRGHTLNLNVEYDIDSTSNVEFRSDASLGSGDFESFEMSDVFKSGGVQQSASLTDYITNSDNLSFDGDLFYRKRFGAKRGRSFTTSVSLDKGDRDSDAELDQDFRDFLNTGNSFYLDQTQSQVTDNTNWGARFSYTEPLGGSKWLEFNYRFDDDDQTSVKEIFDIDTLTGIPDFNEELSTEFQRNYISHRTGGTFRLNTRKSSLSIGAQYQDSDLKGFINQNENPIRKAFRNLLPNLRYRYEFATARSIRFDYRTSINVPSIEELSPIIDNSDPQQIYIGNPDLKAEYVHRANVHFHSFSQFSSTSIFAMIRSTLTKNKIVNATTIDESLRETQTPVNIDSDLRLTGYASFGTPLKFIWSRMELRANTTYNQSKIFINGIENDVDRWTRMGGITFSSLNSEVIEFSVGGTWTQNSTTYSEDENIDQNFFTHNYFGDLTLNFLENWSISTSYSYRLYTGDEFAQNEDLPLWRASLSRYLFEDKRAEIRLSVFDVLDENRGISRTSESNYVQEIRSNSVGRYAMLSFIYSLKGFGQSTPNVRIHRWRR